MWGVEVERDACAASDSARVHGCIVVVRDRGRLGGEVGGWVVLYQV